MFPGQYYDQETGLHYNYFRDYDPSIGRYLQADKLDVLSRTNDPQLNAQGYYGEGWFKFNDKWYYDGLGETNHMYGYAGQNPVNYVDPLGLHHKATHNFKPKPGTISLGDLLSQPNGNMWGDFQDQDLVCTFPGGCLADKIPSLLERCKNHDKCYDENKCNATSWISNALGGTKSCNICNKEF